VRSQRFSFIHGGKVIASFFGNARRATRVHVDCTRSHVERIVDVWFGEMLAQNQAEQLLISQASSSWPK
jgi:hypothetical protein